MLVYVACQLYSQCFSVLSSQDFLHEMSHKDDKIDSLVKMGFLKTRLHWLLLDAVCSLNLCSMLLCLPLDLFYSSSESKLNLSIVDRGLASGSRDFFRVTAHVGRTRTFSSVLFGKKHIQQAAGGALPNKPIIRVSLISLLDI